jgi:hypothetical protein
MGWSLGYLLPKEPSLLDEFFLAVGRALYLSNAFEAKCRHVLRLAKIADKYRQTRDLDATDEFMLAVKDPMLAKAIEQLSAFFTIGAADCELLEKARDARNLIAHEGATVGDLTRASARTIFAQSDQLRLQVKAMTVGDNLISRWIYEIENKEPAPVGIQQEYPQMVDKWIFSRLDELRGV